MRTKFSGFLTLLLAFVVQLTFAQEKTISGTVSDNTGLPLPGDAFFDKIEDEPPIEPVPENAGGMVCLDDTVLVNIPVPETPEEE